MKQLAFFLTFALAVPSFSLFAAGPDDKAAQILQASQAKLESLKDFSANFRYSIASTSGSQKAATKAGKIRYKKGMYAILLDDQEVYCDKVTQWVYLKKNNEVSIMNNDPQESVTVESLFKLYKANGKSRYDGTETVHGVSCHKIYLALSDRSIEYNQAYLWINTKTQMLEKATLIDRRQTSTTYEFSEIKTNLGLADGDFRFQPSKYAGIRVYDER
jgi:outer membrane lipoprotein-sorting protein